jgi:Domain of unknown function (DUF4430)
MSPSRGTAVAIALLWAALATAGCGLGAGEGVGEVSLTVTRDYGTARVLPPSTGEATESDTVMRVLDREAEISTRYSGDFVEAIEGLEAESDGGRTWDWLYYVNGVEAGVGAADYELHGGEAIWWDYRDWSAALRVPAVVGSWPQPFRDGYEGRPRPTAVVCMAGRSLCEAVEGRLRRAGASLVSDTSADDAIRVLTGADDAIRVLVGPWGRVRRDPAAEQLEDGPQESGVFADFEQLGGGYRLVGLDEGGEEARTFGPDAGLVAATRRFGAPPVWIVSGASGAGVRAAARRLSAATLRHRYAIATEGSEEIPLPLR